MKAHTRLVAATVLAGAWTASFLSVQGVAAPQQPAPAAPPQTAPAPAAPAGRGAGRGQIAPPATGRTGGFTQFTRPLAPQEVIARGKALYDTNCTSCHAADLRGKVDGTPNLLRAGVVYRDSGDGTLVGAVVARHNPAIRLVAADASAIVEYIHSVQATMGGQGSPP